MKKPSDKKSIAPHMTIRLPPNINEYLIRKSEEEFRDKRRQVVYMLQSYIKYEEEFKRLERGE